MKNLRVLVVDDEMELVSALVERLVLRDFEARGVTSGAQALQIMDEEPYDVILLDVKMPGIGGLEVLPRLKAKQPEAVIILLTGHGSKDSVEEGMSLGAYDYLLKPVQLDRLMEIMQEAAGR